MKERSQAIRAIYTTPEQSLPMQAQSSVRAIPGVGLEGDRYAEGKGVYSGVRLKDEDRAVSIISTGGIEAANAVQAKAGYPLFAASDTRRNIVVDMDPEALKDLLGKQFTMGGAVLEGSDECTPCPHPSKTSGISGFKKAFAGRGGLRARVIEGGIIKEGDLLRKKAEINAPEGLIAERRSMRERLSIPSRDGFIELKQYIPSDAQAGFELIDRNREHLNQFGEGTGDKYLTAEEFEKSIREPSNPDRLRFGIWSKHGELMGSINLTPSDEYAEVGEVGYYLGREYTGARHTRNATLALADYAFEHLGYKKLVANVHPQNISSRKTLIGAGFTQAHMNHRDEKLHFYRNK